MTHGEPSNAACTHQKGDVPHASQETQKPTATVQLHTLPMPKLHHQAFADLKASKATATAQQQTEEQQQVDPAVEIDVLSDLDIISTPADKVIPWEELHFDQELDYRRAIQVRRDFRIQRNTTFFHSKERGGGGGLYWYERGPN